MKRKKDKSLFGFIKDNCASYDRYYQSCLFADSCKVFDGKRCAYFEKRVLGAPDYPYKIPGYDYSRLFAEYAEMTKTKRQKVNQRRCSCGEPLEHRKRYCAKCRQKRRKESYRKRRELQNERCATVN